MRTRLSTRLALLGASTLAACLLLGSGAAEAASLWTTPAVLATCGATSAPKVVFPFSHPKVASGAGAIIWLGGLLPEPGSACPTAPTTTIDVAGIHNTDLPATPRTFTAAAAASVSLLAPLEATTTSDGHIVAIAGSSSTSALGHPEAMLAGAPVVPGASSLTPLYGPDNLVATANGYIGDADVATVSRTTSGANEIALFVQRHYATSFARPVYLAAGSTPITALALGMDFRADTIVAWSSGGEIWSRWVTNHGHMGSIQRLGPSGADPQISAVLSDDDRAFVAWTDEPPLGVSGTTRVYLDHSAIGVVFKPTSPLEHFTEPADERLGPGAVALERLSGEGLAFVWPTMVEDRYAVEAAGLTSHQLLAPSVLSLTGSDVRLGAVATGPTDDVVAILEVAPRLAAGGFDLTQQALYAARSGTNHQGFGFDALEPVAAAGPNTDPSLAIDPASGRALAAWQAVVQGMPQVAWSLRWQP